MTRRAGDGAGLLAAFRGAVDNLSAHVDEINALNVFPVPDGDTGSNMLATVRAALAEAEAVADPSADRIAQAISFGALMAPAATPASLRRRYSEAWPKVLGASTASPARISRTP